MSPGDKVKWDDNVHGRMTGEIIIDGTETESVVAADGLSRSRPLLLVPDELLKPIDAPETVAATEGE